MYRVEKRVTIVGLALAIFAGRILAGIGTTVPISAKLGTDIAARMFPVTLSLEVHKLFLTEPRLQFVDANRVGLQLRFHAYDHRPEDAVAVSEKGMALISGVLDYDLKTRQILLHSPSIDKLEFDNRNSTTSTIHTELKTAWSDWATDPVRVELPRHPYTLPFRNNIRSLSYDGRQINLSVLYE